MAGGTVSRPEAGAALLARQAKNLPAAGHDVRPARR
jgi:hypothetical protein